MKLIKLNKKGEAEVIVFAVCSMMILMLICGVLDTLDILRKINVVSQTVTYVSRIGSNQGGFEKVKPDYVSGNYMTSDIIAEHVKKTMNFVGIKDEDYDIVISGNPGGPYNIKDVSNIKTLDRASTMNIKATIKYKWNLLSNWLPLDTYTLKTERNMWTIMKIREGVTDDIPIQIDY